MQMEQRSRFGGEMSPIKFKIKTWHRIFKIMLLISVLYLVFSIVPPMIISGVYVGCYLVVFCTGFVLYTRRLIKQGKGEEYRPK